MAGKTTTSTLIAFRLIYFLPGVDAFTKVKVVTDDYERGDGDGEVAAEFDFDINVPRGDFAGVESSKLGE